MKPLRQPAADWTRGQLYGETPDKVPRPIAPEGTLRFYMQSYHQWMQEMNFSHNTVKQHRCFFNKFLDWCEERGVMRPEDVSQELIERYQKHIYHTKKPETGETLSVNAQRSVGVAIHTFFRWMRKRGHLKFNPAADIELPRSEYRLPKYALTVEEVEKILLLADTESVIGIRDRAMMELLYSTGMRREELSKLKLYDLNAAKGTLVVRQGKGKRDRVLPVGVRALAWVDKYITESRPSLVAHPDHGYLFVAKRYGTSMSPKMIGAVVKSYVDAAKLKKNGSCHMFRHAMATHLLEAGADMKFIQQMLGHRNAISTEAYANWSIRKLKEMHTQLHPAKMKDAAMPVAAEKKKGVRK
jgi:integrase/recombinase XerD